MDFLLILITFIFSSAVEESIKVVEILNNSVMKGESEFPGDAGMYCALDAAISPKVSKMSYQKYLENKLLGRSGAKDTIKKYFLAHMNPYENTSRTILYIYNIIIFNFYSITMIKYVF
jgi:hypothetical protein